MFPRPKSLRVRSLLPPGILLLFSAVSVLSFAVVSEGAQIQPRLLHDGIGCIVAGRHAILDALVEPADDMVTVKVYFRAEIYPAFFYVEMTRTGDRFQATLPRPTRDIESVVYYLEAVDRAFNSIRTEEFRPRVVQDPADCGDDSPPPAYLDGPAAITVGATTEGAGLPPGFFSEGIVAVVGAVLRSGGAGTGTWVGIGAAAGAAAGTGVLVAGGSDSSTTTAPAVGGSTTTPITTTAPVTTTVSSSSPLTACFSTDPTPPTIPVGGTVRFDATCSEPRGEIVAYEWDFHDGRDGREGRVISRVYNSPGVFGAELTIMNARGDRASLSKDVRVLDTPAPPPPGPGGSKVITISKGGPAAASLGAQFLYTITVTNTGSSAASGITMTDAIPASLTINLVQFTANADNCGQGGPGGNTVTCNAASLAAGASFVITIAVTPTSPGPITNVATVVTASPSESSSAARATGISLRAATSLDAAFVSEIQSSAAAGGIYATLVANGAETALADDRGPRRYVVKSRPGPNVIEGYAQGSLDGALWKLDFSGSESFAPGTLVVEIGEAVTLGPRSVALRLSGTETRIRIRFQSQP